jgi:DNA-binding MarR family transcriptional regulator
MHTIIRSIKRADHRALAYQRLLLRDYGITPARYEMLFVIQRWCFEWITQAELRRRLGVTAMTVSKMARGLEKQGLVRRARSPLDRRAVEVVLTAKAITLLRSIERKIIKPGIVWMALYSILGIDGVGPGSLKFFLDKLRAGLHDECGFEFPWCTRTTHRERFRKLPPPFAWPA